jgi:hypothetical protein
VQELGALEEFRRHWFVTTLCVATAMTFSVALIASSVNYVRVVDAREGAVLADAVESAEVLSNGSLRVGISIEFRNPSKYDISISTVSWTVKIDLSGTGDAPFLPVARAYKGTTELLILDAGETMELEYEAIVSEPGLLSRIEAYINASAEAGNDYTLETIPYIHDFRLTGWIGDFRHDYQYSGELYLNDMVRIERAYYSGDHA